MERTICPSCDAGDPTSVVTECDCSPEERLYAAAPALLEALERITETANDWLTGSPRSAESYLNTIIEEARAAIKQAKGDA